MDFEITIVGAGVVGLAAGRALARAGHDVLLLERHGSIGSETSSRNSEVIHAGIYYPKSSLKARLCVQGKQMLYDFCESHNVAHRKSGKLIVAADESQLGRLRLIREAAEANGVLDVQNVDGAALHVFEPELCGVAALHSPSTGIVDSHGFMLALLGDIENGGGHLALNAAVEHVSALSGGGFRLRVFQDGEETVMTTRNLVLSGGLHTSGLLRASRLPRLEQVPVTRFAKGNYFRFRGRSPFSRLIYPVPEPGGLGVHLTLDLAGEARFGPDVQWIDEIDYTVDTSRAEKFYDAIRTYWPGLPDGALAPDYAGIRPKITGPGEQAADFMILDEQAHGNKGLIALFGIESPGLTASLAIADHISRSLVPPDKL